jgi:hypothetical protein
MASSNQSDHNPNPVLLQAHTFSELSASKPRTGRSQLGVDFQPSEYSVIGGRGKASFDHPGNHLLRMLVSAFVVDYSQAGRKLDRSTIVASIVAVIRRGEWGACFCRYENGTWCEIGDYSAREKVSAMFRDLLHTQYRSSAKAKTARRRDRTKQNEIKTQRYDQHLVDGTRHPNDGTEHFCAMPSSRVYGYSGSSNDSLGFDKSQEVDFFDIDVFQD